MMETAKTLKNEKSGARGSGRGNPDDDSEEVNRREDINGTSGGSRPMVGEEEDVDAEDDEDSSGLLRVDRGGEEKVGVGAGMVAAIACISSPA